MKADQVKNDGTDYKYQEHKKGFHHKSDRHKHDKKRILEMVFFQ